MKQGILRLTVLLATVTCLAAHPAPAAAHCDTLDGPVVADARKAIERKSADPVAKWLRAGDVREVEEVLKQALAVRGKGPEARELADRHFFETVVRLHRASEGEPYTGLKPAGSVPPCIKAGDKAIETGSVDALAKQLASEVTAAIKQRFTRVATAYGHSNDSVEAGREFVAAYVAFMHYIEELHAGIHAEPAHGAGGAAPVADAHAATPAQPAHKH